MAEPGTVKRGRKPRVIKETFGAGEVAAAVGEVLPGCEIFGVTNGKWSLSDLVLYLLKTTGPADLLISMWTAANADIVFLGDMMREGRIRSSKWVIDFSFPNRQPAYWAALKERFGAENMRLCKTHCKFITIRNENWNLCIRTTMNLNQNRRIETWEVSDDAAMCDYVASIVETIFARETGAQNQKKRAHELTKDFESLVEELGGDRDEEFAASSPDVRTYFGDGMFDADIRRAGITYSGRR